MSRDRSVRREWPAFDPEHDPIPDPILGVALREIDRERYGEYPGEADIGRIERTIATAAGARLAERRQLLVSLPWWQYTARWARQLIPVGLAASVALIVGLKVLVPVDSAPPTTGMRMTLESVLATTLDQVELAELEANTDLWSLDDGDALLRAAIPIEVEGR